MKRKVTLVTIDTVYNTIPLVSGYLQAYACLDQAIAEAWEFEFYNEFVDISDDRFLADMVNAAADVYGISCLLWNMGTVKRTIFALLEARPHAHILLGGPQVMNYAHVYLKPEFANVAVCNGEGERTFRNYLKALMRQPVDLAAVKGLSFYRDGALIRTEDEPRIRDLEEIPSPFLAGLFDGKQYNYAVWETNRGCPYVCNYCNWGDALGSKAKKFSDQRVWAELNWFSEHTVPAVYINDANLGIFPRDIEISRRFAKLRAETGYPQYVGYSLSKNNAESSFAIAEILHDEGLTLPPNVSLQTLSEAALRKVQRQNIKIADYEALLRRLNAHGITYFIELMWPLPGETLASFKQGVGRLFELGVSSIACYPVALIHNAELNHKREEYGLLTFRDESGCQEVETVVQTSEVSLAECQEGWRFVFVFQLLQGLRGLFHLPNYLNDQGIMPHAELYSALVEHIKAGRQAQLLERMDGFAAAGVSHGYAAMGLHLFEAFHTLRHSLCSAIYEYVSSQDWWADEIAQLMFELDMLEMPYMYSDSAIEQPVYEFRHLRGLELAPDGYKVELPTAQMPTLRRVLGKRALFASSQVLVNHRHSKGAQLPAEAMDKDPGTYCMLYSLTSSQLVPDWQN